MEGSRYDADALLRRMRADHRHPWPYVLLDALADNPNRVEHPLSKKETRAIEAASRGLEAQMIADTYCVGVETVKTQLKAARLKLRAKNTTHAVAEALRRGLIQ